jgi:hypothetical protein
MGERMKSTVSNITAELDTCHHKSHGFESWNFQIVFYGSVLILEAIRDSETLSTVLQPMDDTRKVAHGLINTPSCTLIGH